MLNMVYYVLAVFFEYAIAFAGAILSSETCPALLPRGFLLPHVSPVAVS
jgi:hypothetical protein